MQLKSFGEFITPEASSASGSGTTDANPPLTHNKIYDDCATYVDNFDDEDYDLSLKNRIVSQVAKQKIVILASQQKNDPDLTYEERCEACMQILQQPTHFLRRFGKYLKPEHLQYFVNLEDEDEEMEILILEAQKQQNHFTKCRMIRNRRLAALRRMQQSTDPYFSEDEMRKRNPLLYNDLVDKNLSEGQRAQRIQDAEPTPIHTFSEFLFEQIERSQVKDKQCREEQMEEECEEEVEEDDDEEEEEEYVEPAPMEEGEKELLREEFRSTVFAQFIAGEDKNFDYSTVDERDDAELLEWEAQDCEDRYFDEEEPQWVKDEPVAGEAGPNNSSTI